MAEIEELNVLVAERFVDLIEHSVLANGELTLELRPSNLLTVASILRDEPQFAFNQLIDVCGVDYLHYGVSDWETTSATGTGFERGVEIGIEHTAKIPLNRRFASVYHLLSLTHNQRIRLKVFLEDNTPCVPSVCDIWPAANWFEREAFDLLGIIYEGHPDLRRLLTDYGFVGHPFRKDFPLIGQVEARYDATERRVVYEPVSISPRILEPKVIRTDPRYNMEK